ncbi:glycosyltransferase family 2 protein [Candidatus Woesearchaeota archaeon]|nr:MAG: glycosyl transferase family 2 [archaeon GW2011_AR4]MBS3129071.1 glycosyltransferase family 2 protein [Candidatus Woesearchaeota archaeon]HIH37805.1 glycosyltransferase family 2 protein [Candidatus Woesearchaeota archaeon]HIH48421.1 glycosyltransferase family 2 protein [Candidatus Woesearchaeota archaeon]HIJ03930.1 glycosyltransferase family 2 protein [Candidatus Woesearchaeota archaeon]
MLTVSSVILACLYVITLFYTIFWLLTLVDDRKEERKYPKTPPTVDIIIPAYNEEEGIKNSMESVLALDYPKEKLHLIVIDDGSTDATRAKAEEVKAKHKDRNITIISQKNMGKYKAMNAALLHAKGELFACLDGDSFIDPGALKEMVPYLHGNVAIVLPLMKVTNPKNFLQKIQFHEYLVNMFYKRIMSYLNCIHVAPGPFSLYRRKVVDELGGFKEGHKTEDLEMALRIQNAQYKIVQLLDAIVYTNPPDNLKDLYYQRKRWNMGSVLNAWDYRAMMLKRDYGDFGMFQLPIVLSAGFISLLLILLILIENIIHPLYEVWVKFSLIDFDIITLIRNFVFNYSLLDINYYKLIVMSIIFLVSSLIFWNAHKFTKEHITKHGLIPLIGFMFFYYILLGVVWMGVTISLIARRRASW